MWDWVFPLEAPPPILLDYAIIAFWQSPSHSQHLKLYEWIQNAAHTPFPCLSGTHSAWGGSSVLLEPRWPLGISSLLSGVGLCGIMHQWGYQTPGNGNRKLSVLLGAQMSIYFKVSTVLLLANINFNWKKKSLEDLPGAACLNRHRDDLKTTYWYVKHPSLWKAASRASGRSQFRRLNILIV